MTRRLRNCTFGQAGTETERIVSAHAPSAGCAGQANTRARGQPPLQVLRTLPTIGAIILWLALRVWCEGVGEERQGTRGCAWARLARWVPGGGFCENARASRGRYDVSVLLRLCATPLNGQT